MPDKPDDGGSGLAGTWIHRKVLPSTNDLARTLLAAGEVALPLVVVCDRQTSGRGRETRQWWSDAGSLTFSLGIDPAEAGVRIDQGPRVALGVAVAMIEALEPAFLPVGTVGIRWPNDLEAGGRKLSGILPEWVETPRGRLMVIGIGLNVATDLNAAPDEVRRMATSMIALRRGLDDITTSDVLDAILGKIGPVLGALGSEDPWLAERWSALDSLRGQAVRIDLGSRIVAGQANGITSDGGLRLILDAPRPGEVETIVLHGGRVLREMP